LIDYAFNPDTGKLTLGETKSEREAFYFIFRGALGFLRNPPSHRITEDESNSEAFEIICMVDLLLRIVDKAELRQLARKTRTRDRSMKVVSKLPKELPGAAIEIARIRREHSIKIKDGALKPWLSKIEEYCKIDAVYSKDSDKMVGVEPNDPTNLEFFDVTKSHLETKYPNILKAWEELKRVTLKHNDKLAIVLEELRTSIIRELKMHCYYWSLGAEEPEEYIKPDRIAQQIYKELEWRAPHKRKRIGGAPHVTPVIISGEKFYRLEWGNNTLIRSQVEKKVKSSIPLINQLLEAPEFQKEEKSLTKRKDEIYKIKREDFEAKIKDVIDSIELGNVLKGKCRFCP
jgi:hypothetical protein